MFTNVLFVLWELLVGGEMKVCRGLSRLQFARELLELWGEPVQVVVKDIFMHVLLVV